ncbi:hypothetical protein Clacol_004385 [Clathrus columnatus]|uniref:HAT C-terminal dimerisation domain-containing protein n=1 Tax=Clathrus columnatus TaxID=1419009 RepID=A0AAV5AAA3_9AGAM|nr:hypothetical protein Clacol_004385 [Clathrus columnatus]
MGINGECALAAEAYHTQQLHNGHGIAQSNLPAEFTLLKELILFRQVVNRWGSALAMIKRALYLRKAVDIYTQLYLTPKYHISAMEWQVLEDIYLILELLHAVQTLMSAEATPTISFYFPFYFALVSTLDRQSNDPRFCYLSEVLQTGYEKLQEHIYEMRFSKPVLLSIVLHPALQFKWVQDNWPQERLSVARRMIFEESNSPLDDTPIALALEAEWNAYCYTICSVDQRVDLLKWWQDHETQFPRLFRAALDYLPAQASSVPAERIFSAGGETDRHQKWDVSEEDLELENQLLDYGLSLSTNANQDFEALFNALDEDREDIQQPPNVGCHVECEEGEYFDFDDLGEFSDENDGL